MKVEVYDDIACPWCRLGTHQFHRAVTAGPYHLIPDAFEEPQPLMDTMAEMFGPKQAESMVAQMTARGASEGIENRFDRAMAVNTLAAHWLLLLALNEHGAKVQAALATALFDAYFRDGVNVADHTQLTELAKRVGLDGCSVRDFLASEAEDAEIREQVAAARREGITTVPRFVFDNGELIVGVTSTEALRWALIRCSARTNSSRSSIRPKASGCRGELGSLGSACGTSRRHGRRDSSISSRSTVRRAYGRSPSRRLTLGHARYSFTNACCATSSARCGSAHTRYAVRASRGSAASANSTYSWS